MPCTNGQMNLWPYALKLAADLHNATPGISGLSHRLKSLQESCDQCAPFQLEEFFPGSLRKCPNIENPFLWDSHTLGPEWDDHSSAASTKTSSTVLTLSSKLDQEKLK